MLDLKARFDEAGAPFAAMDLTLLPPLPEEGPRPDGEICVEDFPCDAIVPNGLADRIREADQALKEHYAQDDAGTEASGGDPVPIASGVIKSYQTDG